MDPTPRVAHAPLRISFAGGGTDLDAYADAYGGMVVSAAISLYAEARPALGYDGPFVALAGHCAREAYARGWTDEPPPLGPSSPVLPGTGLGSSSAVAVACLKALAPRATKAQLADAACSVEIDRLGAPIGRQDQYAAAFGGINILRFGPDGAVVVEPLLLDADTATMLERRLLLFATGQSRVAGDILRKQQHVMSTDQEARNRLHTIAAKAEQVAWALYHGDLDRFAALLAEGWEAKRGIVAGITTPLIDDAYTAARQAGAAGGKLCGAGGGGHLLLYAIEDRQPAVRAALQALGLTEVPFRFDWEGVRCE